MRRAAATWGGRMRRGGRRADARRRRHGHPGRLRDLTVFLMDRGRGAGLLARGQGRTRGKPRLGRERQIRILAGVHLFRCAAIGRAGVFANGTRFVRQGEIAEEPKTAQGALPGAMEAGLITVDEGELGFGGKAGEGSGETVDFGAGLGAHSAVDEVGFNSPSTTLAPEGGGHFLDQSEFDLVERREALDVLGEDDAEMLFGLIGEHDALGEQTVTEGVERGTGLALGGFGPPGFGAVGA